jgi:hypothetical protein
MRPYSSLNPQWWAGSPTRQGSENLRLLLPPRNLGTTALRNDRTPRQGHESWPPDLRSNDGRYFGPISSLSLASAEGQTQQAYGGKHLQIPWTYGLILALLERAMGTCDKETSLTHVEFAKEGGNDE